MSSGAQVDLDLMGADAGQSGAETSPANGASEARGGAVAGTYLTYEEILGIESPSPNGGVGGQGEARTQGGAPGGAENASSFDDHGNLKPQRDSSGNNRPGNDAAQVNAAGQTALGAMPAWMQALVNDPKVGGEARQLWQEHQAFRAAFASPEEARAMKEMLPGGAQEVAALRQAAQETESLRQIAQEVDSLRAAAKDAEGLREAAQSVDRIDAAIFSGDTRAQSEVVAELARTNPAAFRSMFAEAAKVLASLGQSGEDAGSTGSALRENREGWGAPNRSATQSRFGAQGLSSAGQAGTTNRRQDAGATDRDARFAQAQGKVVTNHDSQVTNRESPAFDSAAYASFERSTNDAVARDVRSAIGDALSRVMPEGVADGAAKRIGEDIFNEVHRALAADPALSEQVGAVLRERRFGSAEQQRVTSLLAGRARQLVPSVARRVIGEWTSSVLGTARSKAARQAAAAARVDIAASGGSLDSTPLRQMSPREVDYARMSDDEILGM
ncbi:MAG: hypothetical protein ACRD4Y_02560 [Candidatus Acidiferrales bacterium]